MISSLIYLVYLVLLLLLLSVFQAVSVSPGGGCSGCDADKCCFNQSNGSPANCVNLINSSYPLATPGCCYDGTVCPYCGNGTSCCTYIARIDQISTCNKGYVCGWSNITNNVICKPDGCAACADQPELCCKDLSGRNVSCRADTSQRCCADGSVCPFCDKECCYYSAELNRVHMCAEGQMCKAFGSSPDQLYCVPDPFDCSCTGSNQCCVVDGYSRACYDPSSQYCCRDGVNCPKTVCTINQTANAECCSGLHGFFCPALMRGYSSQDVHCSVDTKLWTCSKYIRKTSCSQCEAGERCCQDITGKFKGCIDAAKSMCCVLDGTTCPKFLSSNPLIPSGLCSQVTAGGECCSITVNGTKITSFSSCPNSTHPTLTKCAIGGGCQAGDRAPLPPEWSDLSPPGNVPPPTPTNPTPSTPPPTPTTSTTPTPTPTPTPGGGGNKANEANFLLSLFLLSFLLKA